MIDFHHYKAMMNLGLGVDGDGISIKKAASVMRYISIALSCFVRITLPRPPLPLELISLILRHLLDDKRMKDLRSCSRVHSSWLGMAQRLLYLHVVVDTSASFRAVTTHFRNNAQLANYVTTLNIKPTVDLDIGSTLAAALRRMVRLKELYLPFVPSTFAFDGSELAGLDGELSPYICRLGCALSCLRSSELVSLVLWSSRFLPAQMPALPKLQHLEISESRQSRFHDRDIGISNNPLISSAIFPKLISLTLQGSAIWSSGAILFVGEHSSMLRYLRIGSFHMTHTTHTSSLALWLQLLPSLDRLAGLSLKLTSYLAPSRSILSFLPPNLKCFHLWVDDEEDDEDDATVADRLAFGNTLLEMKRADALPTSLRAIDLKVSSAGPPISYAGASSGDTMEYFGLTNEIEEACEGEGLKLTYGEDEWDLVDLESRFGERDV